MLCFEKKDDANGAAGMKWGSVCQAEVGPCLPASGDTQEILLPQPL